MLKADDEKINKMNNSSVKGGDNHAVPFEALGVVEIAFRNVILNLLRL